jgi:hypothetical protein
MTDAVVALVEAVRLATDPAIARAGVRAIRAVRTGALARRAIPPEGTVAT